MIPALEEAAVAALNNEELLDTYEAQIDLFTCTFRPVVKANIDMVRKELEKRLGGQQ
ncbi:hypothetical protein [Bacillus wiedmannii]|uniref:hypothetical protein n=1 Tax=Bacillus wiedmannii TaxID=1890302 RepID=UPI001483AF9C|nr:hypothetical protein [Bacillus wiedmannii]